MKLDEDESRLIEIIREIKKYGYGEMYITINGKEIMTAKQTLTHKLN